MECGSHYYAVLALCRMLGINKEVSYRIAYSSQFVDDALIERVYFKRTPRGTKCHIFGKRRGLDRCATCPRIMTVWSYRHRKMTEELAPFHFIPALRGSRFQEKMRTFPDSPLLKTLMEKALKSGDPYHVGILLHVLGDAWAHQGFSAIISRLNRVQGLGYVRSTVEGLDDRLVTWYLINFDGLFSRLFGRILPMYSHSHVGLLPDIASAEWHYKYDTGKSFITHYADSGTVSNPKRYQAAFDEIADVLKRLIALHPKILGDPVAFQDISRFREQLVRPVSRSESASVWKSFLLENRFFDEHDPALYYDPHAWIRAAFRDYRKKKYTQSIVHAADPAPDFARTDWYAFYLAAREYKEHYDLLVSRAGLF
ncbi:MAG: hypothetical protein JXR21_05470 [Candidatus Marinimicrobia bacterium]|nr:hypothetical protein [Candidatus Neomarinimicrobiota bacterium]